MRDIKTTDAFKLYEFTRSLQILEDSVDSIYDSIILTSPVGSEGTQITVAKKDDKVIIVFDRTLVETGDRDVRYYPVSKIEQATKDYEADGKHMRSYRVDDKFWFFEERIPTYPLIAVYGTYMNAPFLSQQNWEDISDKI